MVDQQSQLLLLPRELRDKIYREYLWHDNGYVHDFGTGKLRASPRSRMPGDVEADSGNETNHIDLRLMFTCRQIASEMRGLPLRLNTIHFSTTSTEEAATRHTLDGELMPRLPPHVFDDLMARFGNRFFAADLRRMRGCEVARPERSKLCYGEVPSLWMLDAMQELTRVIMADRQIRDYVSSREYLGIGQPRRVRLLPGYAMTVLQLGQRPWRVPTDDELDKIAKRLPTPGRAKNNKRRLRATWSQVVGQYQFSAAAVAIDFLESMPVATRRHLRHIILHENRLSVANPECHARGLVPFCDENPALRIDRRVSLWRNCFLQGRHGDLVDHARQTWRLNAPKPVNQLHADQAARPVAQWICEASLLPKQITLIFDCDGTPERTSQVFQEVIQRDAAWQTALDRAFGFPDGSTSPDKFDTPAHIRCIPAYHCEGFPELLRAICDKDPSSRVRCDGFDPGRPWEEEDIQAIIEANRDRTPEEWGIAWERPRVGYKTAPPLPDFRTLLDEEVRR